MPLGRSHGHFRGSAMSSSTITPYLRWALSHRIVTLGTVVATTGPVRDIRADTARVSSSGTVSVLVGDYQSCCGDETPGALADPRIPVA